MTSPRICIDENLVVSEAGQLRMAPWSVPRNVVDVVAASGADGDIKQPLKALPGRLLIDRQVSWVNDAPIDQDVLIRITRGSKAWLTSNPNAIQFRDRWSYAIDRTPSVPVVTSYFNGKCGSAIDLNTNTVAEPLPGREWVWRDCHSSDELVGPIPPGARFSVWYRCYVWTPEPWSDNANKNSPQHKAEARFARIQLIAQPQQGRLVTG